LSVAPSILAVFALVVTRRARRTRTGALIGVLSSIGFLFLLMLVNYLDFSSSVSPPLAAWLPNLTFLGVTATVMRALRNADQGQGTKAGPRTKHKGPRTKDPTWT